jgi:hypothetical protein
MTGHAAPDETDIHLLRKPFRPAGLIAAVRALLG